MEKPQLSLTLLHLCWRNRMQKVNILIILFLFWIAFIIM